MVTTTTQGIFFPLPGYKGVQIATHGGLLGGSDIFAETGTPIVSMTSGIVTKVFRDSDPASRHTGGNAIMIHGDDGKDYYYAHLRDIPLPGEKDRVNAGSVIGYVDTTGNARDNHSAPHLHIGIGFGISDGIGAAGGLGQNFDAVGLLNRLLKDPKANDPSIISGNKQTAPSIKFDASVPGFNAAHLTDILTNIKAALAGGIDPFIWLGIVSKESSFDNTARNPSSGACGYSQLLPCPGNLSPEENARRGVQTLKDKLSACKGDLNCALDAYSGHGGQPYISDVLARRDKIKSANPDIIAFDPNFDVGSASGGSDAGGNTEIGNCAPIKLNLDFLKVGPIGGGTIDFPDPICITNAAIHQATQQLREWWLSWQKEHIPNFMFFIAGAILILIGATGFVFGNKSVQEVAQVAAVAA
jgi:Peptidase family M23